MKQKNGVGQHAPRKTRNSQNIKKASQSAQEIRGTPTTSNPTQMRRRPILWTSRKFAHTGSPIQSYINKSTNHLQNRKVRGPRNRGHEITRHLEAFLAPSASARDILKHFLLERLCQRHLEAFLAPSASARDILKHFLFHVALCQRHLEAFLAPSGSARDILKEFLAPSGSARDILKHFLLQVALPETF